MEIFVSEEIWKQKPRTDYSHILPTRFGKGSGPGGGKSEARIMLESMEVGECCMFVANSVAQQLIARDRIRQLVAAVQRKDKSLWFRSQVTEEVVEGNKMPVIKVFRVQ